MATVQLLAVTSATRARADTVVTLWPSSATPQIVGVTDNQPIELGVRFSADVDGFVSGVRFYKAAADSGTHVGHLWTADGTQLAEATFTAETASGWQQVDLQPPIAVEAGVTYVASYWSPTGYFSDTPNYFAAGGYDNPPLHALGQPNGVYRYGSSGFPGQGGTYNYWVDIAFTTETGADTTPPTVTTTVPVANAADVAPGTEIRATFNEALDPATVTSTSLSLHDATDAPVAADVSYDAASRTARLRPHAALARSAVFTATLAGGDDGVADLAGNHLATGVSWSFTTAAPPVPPADEGPGGPILVVADAGDPFGRYYGEILRAEGLGEYLVTDISRLDATRLRDFDVVVLASMPLDTARLQMLTDWVDAGGDLIAMRPDAALAPLAGLSSPSGTLTNAYLKVDTTTVAGKGIVGDTIQFHDTADRYALDDAQAIATLYANATDATTSPAVTSRAVGANGGHVVTFTYDLARSIVETRQGNPAWAGQKRDGQSGPIRSDDLFFGAAAGDPQPDWVNLDKVQIPQADEQQRLLVNLIETMQASTPLPRLWYFPNDAKAVVVMTGDDHGSGGTAGRFDTFTADSPPGCSVADWQCVRSTSYVYPSTPLTAEQVQAYQAAGFEIALHTSTSCADFTPASLAADYTDQLAQFAAAYPGVAAPTTGRTHCISWSDWASQPKVERANGIRLDTNYYYWPGAWLQNRPGLFTGSGIPMRFADVDGSVIDVYQAATQMTDESDQSYPATIDTLLSNATGAKEYYGAFTANMHTDSPDSAGANAIVASAQRDGVPVVSAGQMLAWLDARNGSSFTGITRDHGTLQFTIAPAGGANGLRAMLPVHGAQGDLTSLRTTQGPVSFTIRTVNGIAYAVFDAAAATYTATYAPDTTAPVVTNVTVTPGAGGTASVDWTTDEPSTSYVDAGAQPDQLDHHAGDATLVTSHHVVATGLAAGTVHYRVVSADATGNVATVPPTTDPPAHFVLDASLVDTTVADFAAGTTGDATIVTGDGDGAVTLRPSLKATFDGDSMPDGWTSTAWNPGGAATVGGGQLTVDGTVAATTETFGPGRTLDFTATFSATAFDHVGLATADFNGSWAMFSTGRDGTGLQARTNAGGATTDETIPGTWLGAPHRYRIVWSGSTITYFVDDLEVASHAASIAGPLQVVASDFDTGGGAVSVDEMTLTPYASTGTFVSRVLDAGTPAVLGVLRTDMSSPAGTTVALSVRTGDAPTPDPTWSAWKSIVPGDAVGATARYLQYAAELTTVDSSRSPTLRSVTVDFAPGSGNHAPVAADDHGGTTRNGSLHVRAPGVLGNDTDPDGDPLTATLVAGPAHGTVELAADGMLDYTPQAGWQGVDSFTYTATDGTLASNVATVTITVTDTEPAAEADEYTTTVGTPLAVGAPGVLANDTDFDGDALAAVLVTAPASGTLDLAADGGFTYTPAADVNGTVSFTYAASDGTLQSAPATVTITILVTQRQPVVAADAYTTAEDTALHVATPGVLGNDSDPDGDVLHATVLAGPSHGSVQLAADGSFTYSPDANWHGTDGFTYLASDGHIDVPAAVTIDVTSVDDAPVATADAYATTAGAPLTVGAPGVLANDVDVDGPALTATLASGPAHGTVHLDPTGAFTYTPAAGFAGTDAFTYRASDGTLASPAVAVTLTVPRVASAPYWRGWDIVRGVMLRHDGPGGYTVDAFGGIHAWGGAPATIGGRYLPGRAWVGGAALTGTDRSGVLVDTGRGSWGFALPGNALPRIDTRCSATRLPTRGIAFDPAATGSAATRDGVEVDGSGAVHRLCGSETVNTTGAPSWRGWDIARGVALLPHGTGGFVLDGFGGIHGFGNAKLLAVTGYWRGWDIARWIAIDGHGHGVVVDAWGGLHGFTYTTR